MDSRYKSKPTTDDCFNLSREGNLEKYFDRYGMTHKKRGIAYIFNNENFKNPSLKTRLGSTKDTQDFKTALIELGLCEDDIHVFTDTSAREMLYILQMFNEANSDADTDCFICAILSYGSLGDIIYGYDDTIQLDRLLSCLRPDYCPSLAGIPKLIFVEASRGNKFDYGVEKSDAVSISPDESTSRIPIMADMLIAYSSSAGYCSFRDKREGSWFMQGLSKILIEYGTKYEILKLLTAVSNYVTALESRSQDSEITGCKQMPSITSSLTKQLKFERKNSPN